ncbi:hypothetical protein [Actinomadura rubrisoli]|uniref:Uncharacterized protein n=1 Tax=Actinomadura rubrisoli TaxID=2530368 RepID=A0A4R5B602_9ACTN|nr:hypothetical protein [Actinomadura rubrisoli]TDD80269.1 hypothetical protein E1298_26130 [Actinomadura rubrisoli]
MAGRSEQDTVGRLFDEGIEAVTIIRRIGAVALAAPLAMSFPVLAAPSAQAATTGVLSPADDAVITSGSQVTARAHFDFAFKMQLRATIPGAGDTFLAERNLAGDLSAPIQLRRNGEYRVYMKAWPSRREYGSHTFTVRIPPAAPTGVSARVSSSKLVVKWNLGLEDDLSGYALSGSGVSSKTGSVSSLCSGTSCSASLPLSRSNGPVSVGVRAKRPAGPGGSVYSGTASASAMAGGGSGPGGLSSGTAPSLSSGRMPPSTATTPLTPFNNESPITLPSVQPNGATPGFAYPTPKIADPPNARNVASTDRLQWGKSVGIALVLLIVAAHLGTWTRQLRVSQAGTSSLGMAARMARGGGGRKRVRAAREQIARAEAIAKTAPVKPEVQRPKPNAKVGRRPATVGKRSSGVNVRIAKPAPNPKGSGRGRRRK